MPLVEFGPAFTSLNLEDQIEFITGHHFVWLTNLELSLKQPLLAVLFLVISNRGADDLSRFFVRINTHFVWLSLNTDNQRSRVGCMRWPFLRKNRGIDFVGFGVVVSCRSWQNCVMRTRKSS